MVKYFAIVTGGSRGIGRGITEALLDSGRFKGIVVTYNKNSEAALEFATKAEKDHAEKEAKVKTVGGDLTTIEARDGIFALCDAEFPTADGWSLGCVVHNAGQYAGISSTNVDGLVGTPKKLGDGSLVDGEDGKTDFSYISYYQKLYGEAFIDICERSIVRMKAAREKHLEDGVTYRGSIVGISSPGCNGAFRVTAGYDMPGSGKCIMEYTSRQYAINLAPLGITCNVVVPGITRSDVWSALAEKRGSTGDAFLEMMKNNRVPIKEIAEPSDIGDLIVFLSGTGGGRFMTGLSLRIDGGLHLT
mmetsp:Transcript_45252/g.54458  ORF Transcript_45252/g.54458 Transcript_45252/m.54458 type:complete len:303 (+) Transcript_45252:39-947(+)